MGKFIKISLIILVLLLITAITLPFLFKDKLIALAKAEANKNLLAKVDFGEFDLTLISSFPDFTFAIKNVSVEGINEFKGDTLLSVKELELKMDLMSVIKGTKMDIHSIILNNPRIHAIVLKNGKANWDITKPEPAAQTTSEPTAFHLSLKKLAIINGYIAYLDEESNMKALLVNMNHTLKGDFTQDIFTMETLTEMDELSYTYGGMTYLNKVKTRIKADLEMDMKQSKYTFKENEFNLNALVFGLDGYVAMPAEDISMDLSFKALKADFKEFLSLVPGAYTKDFSEVKTSGKLAFKGKVKGIYSEKTMPSFDLSLQINHAMFQYPSLPKRAENIELDLHIFCPDGEPDHTVTDIKKFHVDLGGNPLDMHMLIKTPVSNAQLDGAVKGRLDLGSVKDVLPLTADQKLNGVITADVVLKGSMSSIEKEQYEAFDAHGSLGVERFDYKSKDLPYGVSVKLAKLNFSPAFLDLENFEGTMGKSDMKMNGKLDHYLAYAFKDELLHGILNFSSGYFDLNELMGPEEAETTAATDTASLSVIIVPANIDFTLNARISRLLYDKMEISDVQGKLVIAGSMVKMDQIKMNLLQGSMTMNGSYATTNPDNPDVNFDLDIKGFDISETNKNFVTVQKISPVAGKASGKYNTALQFSAQLDNKMSPVLNTLNGKGRLQTIDVVIQNFEPFNKLADALKMNQYKSMRLNNTNLSFKFSNGRIDVDPFDMKIGNSKINTYGSSGFDQSIDYTMNFDVPRSEFGGAANSALSSLVTQANAKGANFSLGEQVKLTALITGTVKNPVIKTGLKEAAGNMAEDLKNKAKEELDKKKAELEAKAREEAEKKRKELEAKGKAEADKLKAEADKQKKEAEEKARAEADKLKAEAERKKKEAEEKAKKEAQNKLNNFIKKK